LPCATRLVAKSSRKGGWPGQGDADAEGIGAVAAVAAAEGRDHRARLHVDEVDGNQPALHRHFREVADAAQVVRVGQRHHAAAGFLRARHGQGHGLLAHDLAVAATARPAPAGSRHRASPRCWRWA
jgi:hypothetical protein